MLIFNVTDGENNIIHCISGPETDFQLDMAGSVKLDITHIAGNFDETRPLKMVFTRSSSEMNTLNMMKQAGGMLPFGGPDFFADQERGDDSAYGGDDSSYGGESNEKEELVATDKDPRGKFTKSYLCPQCLTAGVFLKKDYPVLCGDCMKIEIGRKQKNPSESIDENEV
jgi:hypothetical protein